VRTHVVHPLELGAPELALWQAFQRADPALANPFLSAAFAVAVGRARADARVTVMEDGNDIVGFFAFQRDRAGAGRPIGAGISDCQGVVRAPGVTVDPAALLAGSGLGVWEFDHLVGTQREFGPHHVSQVSSPILDLADGYDAYLAARRHSQRVKSIFRKRRKLEREIGAVRFAWDERDRQLLQVLRRWKSAQYVRTGHRDVLARPWASAVIDELFELRPEGCAGTLSVLWAADQPVAAHLGLRSERGLSYWFPTYDVEVGRFSPGLILVMALAQAAADAGLDHVDLGKGDEEYKQWLKSGDLELAEGWVHRRSPAAMLRYVRREPRRRAVQFVLERPVLRLAARRSLRQLGRVRTGARRMGGALR
jgi:CelD/BcsL family acetyltransferase involved in cellulose biosynthesis